MEAPDTLFLCVRVTHTLFHEINHIKSSDEVSNPCRNLLDLEVVTEVDVEDSKRRRSGSPVRCSVVYSICITEFPEGSSEGFPKKNSRRIANRRSRRIPRRSSRSVSKRVDSNALSNIESTMLESRQYIALTTWQIRLAMELTTSGVVGLRTASGA